MKNRIVRGVLIAVAAVFVLAIIAIVIVQVRWTRRFEAPYPTVAASTDPGVIAHGEYLVYGAAACAYCHVPREEWRKLDQGELVPLSGDHEFPLPFGTVYSANLTPDRQTGIGARTDGELARVLRHGVRADGRAAFPLMEIQLSDDDLSAVLSYLRSRPAVSHAVPEHDLSLLGKTLMAFAIGPVGASAAAPTTSPQGATVERGRYLTHHVSSCVACHTDRGGDGQLVGPPFAGGQRMEHATDPTKVYVTPNLTPDPETSVIGVWDEEAFIARFRLGEQLLGTPMPWGAYGRLVDDDLRAIYRYLRSLPPTRHDTGSEIQPAP